MDTHTDMLQPALLRQTKCLHFLWAYNENKNNYIRGIKIYIFSYILPIIYFVNRDKGWKMADFLAKLEAFSVKRNACLKKSY